MPSSKERVDSHACAEQEFPLGKEVVRGQVHAPSGAKATDRIARFKKEIMRALAENGRALTSIGSVPVVLAQVLREVLSREVEGDGPEPEALKNARARIERIQRQVGNGTYPGIAAAGAAERKRSIRFVWEPGDPTRFRIVIPSELWGRRRRSSASKGAGDS